MDKAAIFVAGMGFAVSVLSYVTDNLSWAAVAATLIAILCHTAWSKE